jgi:hypothetical protein
MTQRCLCQLDTPDKCHWKPWCFECGSFYLVHKAVCKCGSQCGHLIGMSCIDCGSHQQPKTGEGWCHNVREIKKLMKTECIRMGCKRERYPGKDYCGKTHAAEDGAI